MSRGERGPVDHMVASRPSRQARIESPSRYFRGVAQVVERFVRDEEAASSSLVTPTCRKQYAYGFFYALFTFFYFVLLFRF